MNVVYVLSAIFVLDYEEDWQPTRVFEKQADAEAAFKEIRDRWHKNWIEEDEWTVDTDDDNCFCAYLPESYARGHCSVTIEEVCVE